MNDLNSVLRLDGISRSGIDQSVCDFLRRVTAQQPDNITELSTANAAMMECGIAQEKRGEVLSLLAMMISRVDADILDQDELGEAP